MLLMGTGTAHAVDRHWSTLTCPSGGTWLDTCWANDPRFPAIGTSPQASDIARIGGGAAVTVQFLNPAGATTLLGSVQLDAALTLSDSFSTLRAGSLVLGASTTATVTQSAGAVLLGTLTINSGSGFSSNYTLQGGTLTTQTSTVAQAGPGGFRQEGGIHTIGGNLSIGVGGAFAAYVLVGGMLDVGNTVFGDGALSLRGGILRVRGNSIDIQNLSVGAGGGSFGLTVGGSGGVDNAIGIVNVRHELFVGLAASGTLVQNDGFVNVGSRLYISYLNSNDAGSYTLNGGVLSVGNETVVANGGTATLAVRGGTANLGNVVLSQQEAGTGTLRLTGGTLNATNLRGSPGEHSHIILAGGTLGAGLGSLEAGTLDLATEPGSQFTLRIDNSGQSFTASSFNVDTVNIGPGGALHVVDRETQMRHVDNAGTLALDLPQSMLNLRQRGGGVLELGARLTVTQSLTLAGKLRLTGDAPAPNVDLDLLDWGTLAGQFDAIDASDWGLAPGLVLDSSRLYVDGVLRVAAVPEPVSALLLLAGGTVLWVRRRCFNAQAPRWPMQPARSASA